jgi:hypothetical protein
VVSVWYAVCPSPHRVQYSASRNAITRSGEHEGHLVGPPQRAYFSPKTWFQCCVV